MVRRVDFFVLPNVASRLAGLKQRRREFAAHWSGDAWINGDRRARARALARFLNKGCPRVRESAIQSRAGASEAEKLMLRRYALGLSKWCIGAAMGGHLQSCCDPAGV